jgi:hypothetical protein
MPSEPTFRSLGVRVKYGWRCFDGVWRRVSSDAPDGYIPFTRRHRATGRSMSEAMKGNSNRLVHGKRSRAFTERRKAYMQLLRAVREATAKARD